MKDPKSERILENLRDTMERVRSARGDAQLMWSRVHEALEDAATIEAHHGLDRTPLAHPKSGALTRAKGVATGRVTLDRYATFVAALLDRDYNGEHPLETRACPAAH